MYVPFFSSHCHLYNCLGCKLSTSSPLLLVHIIIVLVLCIIAVEPVPYFNESMYNQLALDVNITQLRDIMNFYDSYCGSNLNTSSNSSTSNPAPSPSPSCHDYEFLSALSKSPNFSSSASVSFSETHRYTMIAGESRGLYLKITFPSEQSFFLSVKTLMVGLANIIQNSRFHRWKLLMQKYEDAPLTLLVFSMYKVVLEKAIDRYNLYAWIIMQFRMHIYSKVESLESILDSLFPSSIMIAIQEPDFFDLGFIRFLLHLERFLTKEFNSATGNRPSENYFFLNFNLYSNVRSHPLANNFQTGLTRDNTRRKNIEKFMNALLSNRCFMVLELLLVITFSSHDRRILVDFIHNNYADKISFEEKGQWLDIIQKVPPGQMSLSLKSMIISHHTKPVSQRSLFYWSRVSGNSWDIDSGYGPIHLAVIHGNRNFLETVVLNPTSFYLDGKSSVKNGGRTPLILAAVYNRPEILRLLFLKEANPYVTDVTGRDVFDYMFQSEMDFSILNEIYFCPSPERHMNIFARFAIAEELHNSRYSAFDFFGTVYSPISFLNAKIEQCDYEFNWTWFYSLYQEVKRIWPNKEYHVSPFRLYVLFFPSYWFSYSIPGFTSYVDSIVRYCSMDQIKEIDRHTDYTNMRKLKTQMKLGSLLWIHEGENYPPWSAKNESDYFYEYRALSCDQPEIISEVLSGVKKMKEAFLYIINPDEIDVWNLQRAIRDYAERVLQQANKKNTGDTLDIQHLHEAVNGYGFCNLNYLVEGVTFAHVSAAFGWRNVISRCKRKLQRLKIMQDYAVGRGIPTLFSLLIVSTEQYNDDLWKLETEPTKRDIANACANWKDRDSGILSFLNSSQVKKFLAIRKGMEEHETFALILSILRSTNTLLGREHEFLLDHIGMTLFRSPYMGDFFAYLLEAYPSKCLEYLAQLRNESNLSLPYLLVHLNISSAIFYPTRLFSYLDTKELLADFDSSTLGIEFQSLLRNNTRHELVESSIIQLLVSPEKISLRPFSDVFFHFSLMLQDFYTLSYISRAQELSSLLYEERVDNMRQGNVGQNTYSTKLVVRDQKVCYDFNRQCRVKRIEKSRPRIKPCSVAASSSRTANYTLPMKRTFRRLISEEIASDTSSSTSSTSISYVVKASAPRSKISSSLTTKYYDQDSPSLSPPSLSSPSSSSASSPSTSSQEQQSHYNNNNNGNIHQNRSWHEVIVTNLKYIIPSLVTASLLILFFVYLFQIYQKVVIVAFARDMARAYFDS